MPTEVNRADSPCLTTNSHYLAYCYKKMNLVLGMRGHSNIISFGMGIPFVSIGSHNKNRLFLNDINEKDYLIDIRDFENSIKHDIMIKKIEKLLHDKEYRNRTSKKRNELYSDFSKFNEKIIDILRRDKMEILDLYDDNGNKLDKTIERGSNPETGENIMLSVVYIKDKNGKYLIQKTSKEKGNRYSTTGGHVIHGEDGLTTIIREIKEELGIDVAKDKLVFIDQIKLPTKQCIFNIYELRIDEISPQDIIIQESEVESVILLTEEEIKKIIKEGNFLASHAYIFENYIIK